MASCIACKCNSIVMQYLMIVNQLDPFHGVQQIFLIIQHISDRYITNLHVVRNNQLVNSLGGVGHVYFSFEVSMR